MQVTTYDGLITLSDDETNHPDFKKGMEIGQWAGEKGVPVFIGFTAAMWIGYWVGLGNFHTNRNEAEVRKALVPP